MPARRHLCDDLLIFITENSCSHRFLLPRGLRCMKTELRRCLRNKATTTLALRTRQIGLPYCQQTDAWPPTGFERPCFQSLFFFWPLLGTKFNLTVELDTLTDAWLTWRNWGRNGRQLLCCFVGFIVRVLRVSNITGPLKNWTFKIILWAGCGPCALSLTRVLYRLKRTIWSYFSCKQLL